MHKLEQQKIPLSCPQCKKNLTSTVYDVLSKKVIKCSSCGSELRFDPASLNSLKSSIQYYIQWEKKALEANSGLKSSLEKYRDAMEDVVQSFEFLLKRK